MSINAQMEKVKKSFKLPEEVQKVLSNTNGLLATSGVAPGLNIGEKAPEFCLPDAYGNEFSLSSALNEGPVILVFYRGEWCPFCKVQLKAYQKYLDRFKELGARLIAISPQDREQAILLIKKIPLSFDVLTDMDQKVIKAYRLQFTIPENLQLIYKSVFNLDLTKYTANGTWDLTVPGTYVIDKNGIIKDRHVEMDFTIRMEPEQIIKALKQSVKVGV